MSGGSYSTPQINFLLKQKEIREQQQVQFQQSSPPSGSLPQSPKSPQSSGSGIYSADKPPIPPRGAPPPVPNRQSNSNENISVTLRSHSSVGNDQTIIKNTISCVQQINHLVVQYRCA